MSLSRTVSAIMRRAVNNNNNNNNIGPLNEAACHFLKDLGRRIAAQSGDERESAFLFQRLSVVIQRFNAILLHNSFEAADHLG